ncbi:helix-turn-helix domain-containing protein [Testudinibacter aquarius]|uniref:helix-turn-helix domain-containing protein n=1 Tax=Testudinibacter aquarius TaxID=1524974 RepID=UPI002100381E|nr:helix-turn-helix domain-containing protein [Testudinibacter aquarius]
MLIRKVFKFEIRSNGEQQGKMAQFCSCSCFVFNKALDWRKIVYSSNYNKDQQILVIEQ